MDINLKNRIKLLLMEACKEKWSRDKWRVHTQEILDEGNNYDYYRLADILLHAFAEAQPDNLFHSYLTYCLDYCIVSYSAILEKISYFQDFEKLNYTVGMLELLNIILPTIDCIDNDNDCIALCRGMTSITHWLYSCVYHSLMKQLKTNHNMQHITIIQEARDALGYIHNSTFLKALLYVGKHEYPDLYHRIIQRCVKLRIQSQNVIMPNREVIEEVLGFANTIYRLPCLKNENIYSSLSRRQKLFCSFNAMITIYVTLNPAGDIQSFVEQLFWWKEQQGFTLAEFYCKLIEISFKRLAESVDIVEYCKWAAFSFLKLPRLIHIFHNTKPKYSLIPTAHEDTIEYEHDHEYLIEFEDNPIQDGIEKVLSRTDIFDNADLRSNRDCLKPFLNELRKLKLLTSIQLALLTGRRNELRQQQNMCFEQEERANLILPIEEAVATVLSLPDSGSMIFTEKLLNFLCTKICRIKGFDIFLIGAAAVGKISALVIKLIKLNERNKESIYVNEKSSQTRALLFDVTFLLLVFILQKYGSETVTTIKETKDTFFATWVSQCWIPRLKHSDMVLLKHDLMKIAHLIKLFKSPSANFKISFMAWHEVCFYAPMAIEKLLTDKTLSPDNLKIILDNVKRQMCCVPVCILTWLCYYIKFLPSVKKLKFMSMFQQFMTAVSVDSICQIEEESRLKSQGNENNFYEERLAFMENIIKGVMNDLHLPTERKTKPNCTVLYNYNIRTSRWKTIDNIFNRALTNGCLELNSIDNLCTLFSQDGITNVCEDFIRLALWSKDLNYLYKSIDLVLGIFHTDIENCALALLTHVLPSYLKDELHERRFAEPHGSAFARLVVMTIYIALEFRKNVTNEDGTESSKVPQVSSYNKILNDTPYGLLNSNGKHTIRDPIKKAIADLMWIMTSLAAKGTSKDHFNFPLVFLEQVILCAKNNIQEYEILQFLPFSLVPLLFKISPEHLTHELVVTVGSMLDSKSRKLVARTLCQIHKIK